MDFVRASDVHRWPPEATTRSAPAIGIARPFYSVDAISRPLTEFSGDFYFYTEVRGDLWFALGDFAGHGLRAAIYSSMIQEEIGRAIKACDFATPSEVVASLHSTVWPEFPLNRFASLVVGRMRPDGSLQLSNAGHCRPILRRADGSIETFDSHGPVVGLIASPGWKQSERILCADDLLLLHSDGLTEATNSNDEEVSPERIADWIRQSNGIQLRREILTRFDTFTSGMQTDDVTVMVISKKRP